MGERSSQLDGVESTFREAYGRAVATLVRVCGDISRAEDAVQDAFLVAAKQWPVTGVPPNPAGWIVTTARNRAIDSFRREVRGRELHDELATRIPGWVETEEQEMIRDDQLRLIFTCCHPALRPEHQVALTLRLLGGLSVAEVARAFLVSEAAVAKRLTRAKYKIKAAGIPYRVPDDAELPNRLHAVLTVLYLIYNAGADRPEGKELRADAIRLVRELDSLVPDEPEVAGLLALLLLNESRLAARWRHGEVVVLADQDRGLWDREMIESGRAIVRRCIERGRPGPFQLQAAIQAIHSSAASFASTDWAQVLSNYDQLMVYAPTPVVALNRSIALAELQGPAAALEDVEHLSDELAGYHLFHATRGSMLSRLGRVDEARLAYETAAELAESDIDRRFLLSRAAELVR